MDKTRNTIMTKNDISQALNEVETELETALSDTDFDGDFDIFS